jgi:hypothetical protein
MSTIAEMGRSPMARSRRCIQAGDGPFLTPLMYRPTKSGQGVFSESSKRSSTPIGLVKAPGTGVASIALSWPISLAARSRAMP